MHLMPSDWNASAAGSTLAGPDAESGGVIRLGSHAMPAPDGGRPLVIEFQVTIATGQRGQQLAVEQAAALAVAVQDVQVDAPSTPAVDALAAVVAFHARTGMMRAED